MNFVAKPAEAKAGTLHRISAVSSDHSFAAPAPKAQPAPTRTYAAARAVAHTPGAQDSPTTQREEDRLAAALSKPHTDGAAHSQPRYKQKELTEEEKARIKAHEEVMRKREEEAKAAAELERKQAERRAQVR